MRISLSVLTVAGCLGLVSAGRAQQLELQDLGDGVYAAIRPEPLSLAVQANSLFIVTDSGVVVVDAQFTRAATLENLAALRRVTSKPVQYVINTHWHDDHVAGNQVYQDSFPAARFLAHAHTRDDLVGVGRQNRADQLRYAPPAAERYQRLLAAGLGMDSTAATPAERAAVRSALDIIRQYLAESGGFREVLPEPLASERQTLVTGGRTIELRWYGRGNTRGDVVVFLPRERVLATGDLLVAPVPFAFNSYPSEWRAVLDSLAALRPRVLVPGHGELMRDLRYLQTVRAALADVGNEARAAVARGISPDSALATIALDTARDAMAGADPWLRKLFQQFFRVPLVRRALQEATGRGY